MGAKVRRVTEAKRFFLGSISSSCLWLDGEIEEYRAGRKPGWKDKVLAGLIMQAHWNECFIDAVGTVAIPDWKPHDAAGDKIRRLRRSFFPDTTMDDEPFRSVEHLRKLRNAMVHSSPEIDPEPLVEIVELTNDGSQDIFKNMDHSLENRVSLEDYFALRDEANCFRELVLKNAGLLHYDLMSTAEQSGTVLRNDE